MLLTREEMTFDFGGAKLDPVRDRELLEWMFNQFLYGEVTGIQVGHWLYDAPDFEAARFLARQSLEEMRHVEFGEQQTAKAIAGKGWLRRRLLGLSLVSMWGVRRLARYMENRLGKDH